MESNTMDIITRLVAAFPQNKITMATIEVYCEDLADMPTDLLRLAAAECRSRHDWFPTIHQIRQAAVDLGKRANQVPSAAEAWKEVQEAPIDGKVRRVREAEDGWHIDNYHFQYSHPLVDKVARDMGWPGKFPTDNPVADRARFLQAYEAQIDATTAVALSLPEVRGYVESGAVGDGIKKLTKGMER